MGCGRGELLVLQYCLFEEFGNKAAGFHFWFCLWLICGCSTCSLLLQVSCVNIESMHWGSLWVRGLLRLNQFLLGGHLNVLRWSELLILVQWRSPGSAIGCSVTVFLRYLRWLAPVMGSCLSIQACIPLGHAALWSYGHTHSVQDPAQGSGSPLQGIKTQIKNVTSSPACSICANFPFLIYPYPPSLRSMVISSCAIHAQTCSCACSTALPFLMSLVRIQGCSLVCMLEDKPIFSCLLLTTDSNPALIL